PVVRIGPVPLFQFVFPTTPALSPLPSAIVGVAALPPTKFRLMPLAVPGGALIAKVAGMEWVKIPAVPVIVSAELPGGIAPVVVTVIVALLAPLGDAGFGLKLA